MIATLQAYEAAAGKQAIDDLRFLAERMAGKTIQHVNSTAVGGGVAEILNRMVPLFNEMGIKTRWDVIKGGETFYQVTKSIHNALHGQPVEFTRNDWKIFLETNVNNSSAMTFDADYTFIHDPQPIGLISKKDKERGRWIWRCHVDVSDPQPAAWDFLERFINQYDGAIFSAPQFTQQLHIRQFLIAPSIDPLSDKNRELPQETIDATMQKLEIPRDKPIVTQVSRFDALKDPVGVIEAFLMVRKTMDCRLILVGGGATDDPEGAKILAEVREKGKKYPDIHVLELPPTSHIEINAIQRASDVIVQKSIREGFGLTVSEALWKGKAVVASAVGGIPMQISHKYSGLLCRSIEGCAFAIKQLLNNPAYAKRLGENGREHVRQNFLLTRQLKEYLLVATALEHKEDIILL